MLTPSLVVAGGLETTLNAYLRLDPDSLAKAAALAGKAIALDIAFTPPDVPSSSSLSLTLFLLPHAQGIHVLDSYPGEPDVSIRGSPLALARQLQGSAVGVVDIRGDPQVGKAFQDLLLNIDIDWEERLSRLIGDVAAHQVGNLWRDLRAWGRRAVDTLFLDAGEYLREEARHAPPAGAVGEFMDAVDQLRDDTERLEARIRRLREQARADESL